MVDTPKETCSDDNALRGKRLKTQVRVYYGPAQKTILSDFCADISTGGLFLGTNLPFKVGQAMTLYFSLPGQTEAVKCNARVAWINHEKKLCKPDLPVGVGVEFMDLSPENLAAINSYVNLEASW